MSFSVKFAFMLMLATSACAQGNAFTDKGLPSMTSAGAVVATNAALPPSEVPENNRTAALVIGIAAVAVTFHRALFRGRRAA